jgi:hypothetical protein
MTEIRSIPIFFILGRPRSGTTLLSALFDAHPNVRIPPEYPIFLSLIQRFKKVRTWDEPMIFTFVEHIFRHDVFNHYTLENLKIDREKLTASLLSLGPEVSLSDLMKTFQSHAYSIFPKKELLQIGDKNPLYSIYFQRFLRIFTDARFICITRDYRDNYISMKGLADLELEAPILSLQVARWRFVARSFLQYRNRYPHRFYLVRYEDLVTNPEGTMQQLCRFLSLPYEPSVFDFYKKKEETLKVYPRVIVEKVHKSLMHPVSTSRMGLWKRELTERQVRIADAVAGKYADILDYERLSRKVSPGLFILTRPVMIYAFLLFWMMQLGFHLPYRISGWLTVRLLILVKTWFLLFGRQRKQDSTA